MRPIKFRGWDTVNNHFVDKISIHWDGDIGWTFRKDDFINVNAPQIILEQFTGCNDNSYDGDIVAVKNGEGTYIGVIKYDNDAACFFIDLLDGTTERLCDVRYKIIGNIHENPELLEAKP